MKAILRLRLKVPGHGAKIARLLGIPTISQTGKMTRNNKEAPVHQAGDWNWDTPITANVMINYGVAHDTPFLRSCRERGISIFNDPLKTEFAADKVKCLALLTTSGVPTLEWTESKEMAEQWARNGSRVFCRTLTRAKKGKGIVIASTPDEVVRAPLYTKEYAKTHEHRVHVFKRGDGHEIIDYAQKKPCPRLGGGAVNTAVRNRDEGWYFSHTDRRMSQSIKDACIAAAKALDLDYAAIDVMSIWEDAVRKNGTKKRGFKSCVICEVNTAPGMKAPATLEAYRLAFQSL